MGKINILKNEKELNIKIWVAKCSDYLMQKLRCRFGKDTLYSNNIYSFSLHNYFNYVFGNIG